MTSAELVDGSDGTARLRLDNSTARDVVVDLQATIHAGPLETSWAETPAVLGPDESMQFPLEVPSAALMDERQRGYVSTLDLQIRVGGELHSITAYVLFTDEGGVEVLTEQAIHTPRDGWKPAHGKLDLPDDLRVIAHPPIPHATRSTLPTEDTGLPEVTP